MTLSRRDFLQILGLTAAGVAVGRTPFLTDSLTPATLPETVRGRVLGPTTTRDGGTVWADTLVAIHGRTADVYHTNLGELPVVSVQPIAPASGPPTAPEPPFDAQVRGPVGVVRAYCDPHAPLVARIGHGGVMGVRDRIHYPHTGDWYQVTDVDGAALGWAQAAHWSPVGGEPLGDVRVTIHREAHTLSLGDGTVTAVNLPTDLPTGETRARRVAVGGGRRAVDGGTQHGVPYWLQLADGTHLHGVYWHNRYGGASAQVEVNTLVAAVLWRARKIHVSII